MKSKKSLFPLLLLIAELSFGQTYYTFNSDSLFSELAVRAKFEEVLKTLPKKYFLTPTVYHRIIKHDSIINYISFIAKKSDSIKSNSKFELVFEQDSVFLLLNKKLPEFELKDLNGNKFSSFQLIGKPTLLNYWAIYCAPCVAEIPELNKLKEKYGDRMNFIALTENICKDDDLIEFTGKHPFNFILLENAEFYKKSLKIRAIPRNLFIDKEGYIRYIQGNFPYIPFDPQKGTKEYNDNNYFVKIIEELIEKQQ